MMNKVTNLRFSKQQKILDALYTLTHDVDSSISSCEDSLADLTLEIGEVHSYIEDINEYLEELQELINSVQTENNN